MKHLLKTLVLLLAFPALAQQSASYELNEHTLNAGGHPSDGTVLVSAGYEITLDVIGGSVVQTGLASSSFEMDGGFASAYPPPGEVVELRFTGPQTLVWDPEKSVGLYNLYRSLVDALDGTFYGSCEESGIASNTTADSDPVPVGNGYFYLVSAENRLNEEGTLGTKGTGAERPNTSACP